MTPQLVPGVALAINQEGFPSCRGPSSTVQTGVREQIPSLPAPACDDGCTDSLSSLLMKGYSPLCVPTHSLTHVLVQRKTSWHKGSHVCFVSAVCLGVKCRVYVCVCVGRGACVGPWPELRPSAGRCWMPSVTLEASVWTQLGLLCEVEGPLVSVRPAESRLSSRRPVSCRSHSQITQWTRTDLDLLPRNI